MNGHSSIVNVNYIAAPYSKFDVLLAMMRGGVGVGVFRLKAATTASRRLAVH